MTTQRIDIWGSCVTRDVFNEDVASCGLGTYIARQSVMSAVCEPVVLDLEKEIKAKSNFQRKNLLSDLQKTGFQRLRDGYRKDNLLVLDFIDERFNLWDCAGSIATYSSEFSYANLFPDGHIVPYSVTDEREGGGTIGGRIIEDSFNEFSCRLLKIYRESDIIIHAARMMDTYKAVDGSTKRFSENTLKQNAIINRKIDYLLALSRKNFPNARAYLDISEPSWVSVGLRTTR